MWNRADIEAAREWLRLHGPATHARHVIERGLEYAEAVIDAGLAPESIDGQDLHQFLTHPDAATARQRTFVQPTL